MSSDHTRRELVRTLSAAGLLGFLGGTGTYAALTDGAIFEGSLLETGALDLEVAAASVDDASVPPPTGYADGETVQLSLPELRPGDEGVVSVAVRSCDSPARVWLRTPLAATGPLADALAVTLDARVPGGAAERRLFEGSLAGLTDALADGTLLGRGGTATAEFEYDDRRGTFAVEAGDGRVLADDPPRLRVGDGDAATTVELRDVTYEDGEEIVAVDVVAVDGGGVTAATLTGGGGPGVDRTATYTPAGCADRLTGVTPPDNPRSGGTFGLSGLSLTVCGPATCLGCAPGRLDLGWRLPSDAPATVGGETATLELAFEARQCRHTTPENPW